jgi:hypothetical protein
LDILAGSPSYEKVIISSFFCLPSREKCLNFCIIELGPGCFYFQNAGADRLKVPEWKNAFVE